MFASGKTAAVASAANYIEDVFSTYLYTGNGATGQAINNGINLSTKGGLVWLKSRSTPSGSSSNNLYDTVRGASQLLISNSTDAQTTATRLSFQTTGFNLTNEASSTNESGVSYASWTFRKQPKFFDVVTYTGTGSSRTIAHNLGSAPGFMIIKSTSVGDDWYCYHRSLSAAGRVLLNSTNPYGVASNMWNNTDPTSTVFTLGSDSGVNGSGVSYVAYLFAHNAGGFGLTGTDNVISCGSYSGSGVAGNNISVGFEAQWVLIKRTNTAQDWFLFDNMRGMCAVGSGSSDPFLTANTSDAEVAGDYVGSTATGFVLKNTASALNASGGNYIYIAIRRGPMKVPTSGTSVFTPVARSGTGSTSTVSNGITTDLIISMTRNTAGIDSGVWDRLRSIAQYLATTGTASESTSSDSVTALNNTSYVLGADTGTDRINRSGYTYANWTFSRAPNFFDEVCYTGNGTAGATQTHNLGAVPEMMIVKDRNYSGGRPWTVYHSALGATKFTYMNQTTTPTTSSAAWNDTAPTASVFTLGSNSIVNFSGTRYVAYLFATCAGVSKVGSYTGTGALQTINCGFTSGARFVYIHRTDSAGDWYVWDSARGITSGNDPYLLMNSAAAEVTGTNYVDTDSTGFKVTAAAPAALNASGGTYIFLAIA